MRGGSLVKNSRISRLMKILFIIQEQTEKRNDLFNVGAFLEIQNFPNVLTNAEAEIKRNDTGLGVNLSKTFLCLSKRIFAISPWNFSGQEKEELANKIFEGDGIERTIGKMNSIEIAFILSETCQKMSEHFSSMQIQN